MGKTLTQMRADMRTDLKDSATTWSDAELNRCIERAVSDFNRYIPDQKTYELTTNFAVSDEAVTFPIDTDADRIVDGADIHSSTSGSTVAISAQPDVPRCLTMTVTDASSHISSMVVIVKGTDKNNIAQSESLIYYRSSGVITGKKVFKTVNEVEIDYIAGNSAGELLDIGVGAYTDTWVYLANCPIKANSDSGSDAASASLTRNTDYAIDYIEGKVKAISGGIIAAGEACTFSYSKLKFSIPLTSIPNLIRVQQVEYPIDQVPQSFIGGEQFGDTYFVGGSGEYGSQAELTDGKNVRIYYDSSHIPPNDYAPGTIPEFLENTVILLAEAYALYLYALSSEHLATISIAAATTSLGAATTAHTAFGTALTNVKKYLDNNSDADAAGVLADITSDAAELRTAIGTALTAMRNMIAEVDTTDLAEAESTISTGIDTINDFNKGGEGTQVPLAYKEYVSVWQNNAATRINMAIGYAQEVAQRLTNLNSYLSQSSGYQTIAGVFAREAEARASEILSYIQQALQYSNTSSANVELANGFRLDADERRTEVYSIWRDRKQYIGDYVVGSVRQISM